MSERQRKKKGNRGKRKRKDELLHKKFTKHTFKKKKKEKAVGFYPAQNNTPVQACERALSFLPQWNKNLLRFHVSGP